MKHYQPTINVKTNLSTSVVQSSSLCLHDHAYVYDKCPFCINAKSTNFNNFKYNMCRPINLSSSNNNLSNDFNTSHCNNDKNRMSSSVNNNMTLNVSFWGFIKIVVVLEINR